MGRRSEILIENSIKTRGGGSLNIKNNSRYSCA